MSRYMPKFGAQRDKNEKPIVEGLEKCGWKVTRFNLKDWPDLHLGKPNRSVWVEVKMPGEKPTEDQAEQHLTMREWGMEVRVASDLDALLRELGVLGA